MGSEPHDLTATVRLALVPGVGPRTRMSLLERFGDARQVLEASAEELLQVSGVGPRLSRAILSARTLIDAEGELELCRQQQIDVLTETHAEYPPQLSTLPDPPGVLFRCGRWQQQDNLAIAIVGTRHASPYGRRQAERLAAGLARCGVTVVSGLARGIDAAAHHAALQAGGRTIAFLGSGLLNVYPPEHAPLARQIAAAGAVFSEMPPRSHPLSGAFPQRNRLIAGVSLGVVVVEAPERSGALITAEHAMEQGREVFAVPGPVDQRGSRGCHRLLRDGARLVESVEDILEELGPLVAAVPHGLGEMRHPGELLLNEQERAVLDAITTTPISIDRVVHTSGLPVQRVLATISVLEVRHLIRRISGSTLARV